jgi:hypothetical protein
LIIIKKTQGQVQLRDENGDIIKINKSKFAEKVKTVRDKPTKSEDKIDPKDEKLAEETLENLENSEKDDTKSINDVENKSQDEINDDYINAFKNNC